MILEPNHLSLGAALCHLTTDRVMMSRIYTQMRNMSASYKQETNLAGAMQAEFSISSVEKVVSFLQKLFFACNLFTLLYHDLPRNHIFIKQAFYLL